MSQPDKRLEVTYSAQIRESLLPDMLNGGNKLYDDLLKV